MKALFNKIPHPARWIGWFYAGNIVLLVLLAQQYLLHGTPPESFAAAIYWVLQTIGHFTFLGLALYLPLLLISALLPFNRLVIPLAVVVFSLLLLLIQADIQVFSLYRIHFNAVIWEFLTTKDVAAETFVIDPINFVIGGAVVFIVVVVEALLARFIYKQLYRSRKKYGKRIVATIIVIMLVGQGWHLIADARRDSSILGMVSLIPWPQGVTAKRFLRKQGIIMSGPENQGEPEGDLFSHRAGSAIQ